MASRLGFATVGRAGWAGMGRLAAWLVVVALAPVLAVLSVHSPRAAVVLAALFVCIALAIYDRAIVPAVAVVGTLVVARIGGGSENLSASDALLAVGTLAVLPDVALGQDAVLRRLLWGVGGYQALLLVAALYHPYRADLVEWFHEAFIVGGGLLIGWTIGRAGRARTVLAWWLAGCCVLALAAVAYSAAHGLQPANLPGSYQKNFIGAMVALGGLLAFADPVFLGLTTRWRRFVIGICIAGLLASQSRQAMIAFLLVGFFVAYRRGGIWRNGRLLAAATVPALAYLGVKIAAQAGSANRFNSFHQRLTWYSDSVHLFHLSPFLGVGLRWWYTPRFAFSFQPPNAELEMLTSAGVLGLLAFVVLCVVALRVLWRLDPVYGTVAVGALAMRLIEGQFDIFWVGGETTIAFMVVGITLGARLCARPGKAAMAEPPPLPVSGNGAGRARNGPGRRAQALVGGAGGAERVTYRSG